MIKQNRTYKNPNCVKKRGGLYFKRDHNNKIVFLYEFVLRTTFYWIYYLLSGLLK